MKMIHCSDLHLDSALRAHLSPEKADKLLLYFMEQEPQRLELADYILQNQ